RELVVHAPRERGIDVDRLDVGLHALEAADPRLVVFGDEAERRGDAYAERELLVERDDEIGVRDVVRAPGVAAGAAERLERRRRRAIILELERRSHEADAEHRRARV